MSPEEKEPGRLYDMLLAARLALRFTDAVSQEEFLEQELTHSAVLHQLMIIGEAANHVSAETRASMDVPWRRIVAQRHVVVHGYGRIDLAEIWTTVRTDLPPLIAAIETHLAEHP